MAPKKKLAAAPHAPIPPPNLTHPCANLIPAATASTSHLHSPSYHWFITSPHLPKSISKSSAAAKGKGKASETARALVDEPVEAEVLNAKLLGWYDGIKTDRGMPWRKELKKGATEEERSQRGYEVWVSEIMLQQTQVSTVISYWTRWVETFPTVKALAEADIEVVNGVWAGLGYYSRASRLLEGAKTVMRDFRGRMPESAGELEKIDGIGPYSAGAISSIAFSRRAALVDGNVTRVLSRLTAFHAPQMAKPSTNFIWSLADLLVPDSRPGDWNQALMELGATVCKPQNPDCSSCPIKAECLAYAEVRLSKAAKSSTAVEVDIEDLCDICTPFNVDRDLSVTQYPQAKDRKKAREEETAVCVVEWDGKVLIVKRPEKGLLAGLFEFPSVDLPPSAPSTAQSRTKYLHALLSSLIVDPVPALVSPTALSKHSSTPPSSISLKTFSDLSSILHVYSHQKRDYHIVHVRLSSSIPIALASAPVTPQRLDEAVSQSLAGRAKWVDTTEVATSNLGGAMVKIWEVVLHGRPAAVMGGRKKPVVEKGQTTLKLQVKTVKKPRDEDNFVVSDGEEVVVERQVKTRVRPKPVEAEESVASPRKKRRIIILGDSDEC